MSGCKYQAADGSVCGKHTKPGSPWCWGHAITIDNQIAASAARLAAEAAAKAEQAKMRDLDADLHARVRREAVWEADHGAGAAQPAQQSSDPGLAASKARLDATIQSVNQVVASINTRYAAPVLDPTVVSAPVQEVDGTGRALIRHPAQPRTPEGAQRHALRCLLWSWPVGILPFFALFYVICGEDQGNLIGHLMVLVGWPVCSVLGYLFGYYTYGGEPERVEYQRTPMEEIAQDFVHAYRQRTWYQRGRGW